jgi:primosomal protein N' (replication factor Y) (superfamily II helicase)
MTILHIAVAKPLRHFLDYLPPEGVDPASLIPGVRVTVPFRNKPVTGIFMGINPDSNVKTSKMKRCIAVLDTEPVLSTSLLQILTWASNYYHHPIGEVIMNALPSWLRQGKSTVLKTAANKMEHASKKADLFPLNPAQVEAVNNVHESFGQFKTFLLEGVTGSGKTEVYFELIQTLLKQGKQTLLLVPEIGLTPQLITRFKSRFTAPMAVLHSKLTPRQRFHAWQIATTGQAAIIIGTRSAIFTPIPHLGLIIIDEEHDPSFKQQDNFRYSARDIAIMRSQLESIPILLGSATPSLESLFNVKKGRYECLQLPQRAGNAVLPHFHIIDIRKQPLQEGLSLTLIEQIHRHLEQGGQTLLFLNRRGFAPTMFCHSCGHVATCRHCDAHFTLHYEPYILQCHHCGATRSVLKECPSCKTTDLIPLGVGTERLEQALISHFPDAEIIRIDRDTTRRKGSLQDPSTHVPQK